MEKPDSSAIPLVEQNPTNMQKIDEKSVKWQKAPRKRGVLQKIELFTVLFAYSSALRTSNRDLAYRLGRASGSWRGAWTCRQLRWL